MDINVIDSMDFNDIDDIRYITYHPVTKLTSSTCPPPSFRSPLEELLSEEDFRYKYRFTKRVSRKIVDLIKDKLPHDARGAAIITEMQVVCALRSWGRHEIQDDTADLHGVSQPVESKICKNISKALAQLVHRYIRMLVSLNEQESNMSKFRSISNFPTVICAIDRDRWRYMVQTFINRKGYPSINVQVVCDADLKIMDIAAAWRGSAHDSILY